MKEECEVIGSYQLIEDRACLDLSLSHFFMFISDQRNWRTYRTGFVVVGEPSTIGRGTLFTYRHHLFGFSFQTVVEVSRWNPMNGECVFILKKSLIFSKLSCMLNVHSYRDAQSELEVKFGYQPKFPFSLINSYVYRSVENSFYCFFDELVSFVSSKIQNISTAKKRKNISDRCILKTSQ